MKNRCVFTMRSSRKLLCTVLLCILLTLTAGFISACASENVKLTFMDGDTVYEVIEGEAGDEITPPDPQKSGYRFAGWYLDANFSGEAQTVPAKMPEESVTYYARWIVNVPAVLKLSAGGVGTLIRNEIPVNVGDNVLKALMGNAPILSPEVAGLLTFGGWFYGTAQVTEDTVVPAGGMELTAKYKISYTVNLYLEGEDGAYAAAPPVRGASWYREAFQYAVDPKLYPHYVPDEGQEGYVGVTPSLDETNNTFTVYLKRERFTVTYDGNAGTGTDSRPLHVTGSTKAQEVVYGSEVKLAENGFVPQGTFRFAGWAHTPNGAAEYQAGERIPVSQNMFLYAVWEKGYRDRFGGSDVIYFPKAESGVAVLVRGGREFFGTALGDGSFTFTIREGDAPVTLTGRAEGDTFAYRRSHLEGTYTLYDSSLQIDPDTLDPLPAYAPHGLQDAVTLTIDGYTATYRGVNRTVSGPYGYDSALQLYYIEAEENLYFSLGKDASDGERDIFYLVEVGEVGVFRERIWLGADGASENGRLSLELFGNGRLTLKNVSTGETFAGLYASYPNGSYENAGGKVTFYTALFFQGDNEAVPFRFYVARMKDGAEESFFTMRIESAVGEFAGTLEGQPATIRLSGFSGFEPAHAAYPEEGARVTLGEGSAAESYSIYDVDGRGLYADYLLRVTDATSSTVLTFRLPKDAGDGYEEYTVRLFREGNELKFEIFRGGEFYWLFHEEGTEGGDNILPVLLTISDAEYAAVAGSKAASVYVSRGDTGDYEKVSEGYVTEAEGPYGLQSYVHAGHEAIGAGSAFFRESFTFRTLPIAAGRPRATYLVYEIDGDKLYDTVLNEDGELLLYRNVQGQEGIGSFYRPQGGQALEGSLKLLAETIAGADHLKTFSFTKADGTVWYFDVECTQTASGGGTDTEYVSFVKFDVPLLPAPEYREFYPVMGEGGVEFRLLPTLFYESTSGAWKYTVYHTSEGIVDLERAPTFVRGTVTKETKKTSLGYDIFTFTPNPNGNGVRPFTFSPWKGEDGTGMLGRLSREREAVPSSKGDEMILDGYAGATLETAEGAEYSGNYFLQSMALAPDVERQAITFIASTGEKFLLVRNGEGFYFPDELLGASFEGIFEDGKTGSEMPFGNVTVRCLGDGTLIFYGAQGSAAYERVGEGRYSYHSDAAGKPLLAVEASFNAKATGGTRRVTFLAHITSTPQGTKELHLAGEEALSYAFLCNEEDWSVITYGKGIAIGESSDAVYCDALGYSYRGTFVMVDATHGIFLFSSEHAGEAYLYFTYDADGGTFTRDPAVSAERKA